VDDGEEILAWREECKKVPHLIQVAIGLLLGWIHKTDMECKDLISRNPADE
jgi:hypothetical protein